MIAALKSRLARMDRIAILAVPALLYMIAIFAIPVAGLLVRSFNGPDGFTLAGYVAFLTDAFNWRVIGNTLRVAAITTLICLAIGYPTAVALSRARGVVQVALLVAIILPLSVGVVVKALAWQIVLRRDGIVANFLVSVGVWDSPKLLLFTETGGHRCGQSVSAVHDPADLFGAEARRSQHPGCGRHAGCFTHLPFFQSGPAAGHAGYCERRIDRLFAGRVDVRDPEPADRR